MTSRSNAKRRHTESSDYGFSRARDLAFDAIRRLWKKRQAEGMKQSDIARILGKDTAWVSRQLSGPGNWTLRSVGELCEAMRGELVIEAMPVEVPESRAVNFHAYAGYGDIRLIIQGEPGLPRPTARNASVPTWNSVTASTSTGNGKVGALAIVD